MSKDTSSLLNLAYLAGGGEMGARMRAYEWETTPFGPLGTWPQSLLSAVSIMLNSRYPIALYWGPELALVYNDAWSPILGRKHPWALGRPGREVWPEIWDTIGPLYDTVFATGEGVWQEDELLPMMRRGYLEECYYNFTFSPVRGEDGTIDGIFNAVVETTDRVLSERRLRTLGKMGDRTASSLSVDEACRRAIETLAANRVDVPFALTYLCDHDRHSVHLVAAAEVAAGSPAAPLTLALDGGAENVWPIAEAQLVDASVVIAPPGHLTLPSGIWPEPVAEVIVVPVTTAGQERPCAFLVAGVNPRRRIDASYRSFFELAAGHFGTAISAANAYEEARRRAQALAELDRAKTQFFSNVSHEFRTPLTLMLGPLGDLLAESEALAPHLRERLDLAHRNALRLQRLVNALLDFSRIEVGRVQAIFRPTDLPSLTADLASSFRAATDKAGLALVVETAPLPQQAYVDRDMWETIVLNLMSNAFKFTFSGEISVALEPVDGKARLMVRDTGTGIPEAEVPRLFDRFHRIEGATGRSIEGSGIGLALVQELVNLHGGEISVESAEGKGTTFTIEIPLGRLHLPAERVETDGNPTAPARRAQSFVDEALRWMPGNAGEALFDAEPPTGHAHDPALAKGRVIVADDNADLRAYIARLLAEGGYQVEAVADGQAALDAALAHRPDLLITDVMMPGLDGFALLGLVRADEALRAVPVIMLSARAGDEAKVEGLHAGADDYLTKPFSARELLARVSTNIAMAQLRGKIAAAVVESEARFRTMADQTPTMMWLTDATGARTYLNTRWYEFTGQDAGAGEGGGWLDAVHPDDRATAGDAFLAANAQHRNDRIEYRLRRADGEYRWVIDAAAARFSGEGAYLGSVGSIIDIDERREMEYALREANEQLETRVAAALAERKILADLVEGTDAFVQVAGLDFRWLAINKAAADEFQRLFGVRPKVGVSMLELLAGMPDHQQAVRALWTRAFAGEEFTEIGEFGDPGRRRRFYEIKFNSLRDADGQLMGAYQFVYDVTDRVREQQRLAAAEEALRQSQKMEAMGQLTGGVAHDFNNLLTPIVGALDLLQRRGLGGEREQRLIDGAAKSADRAKTLVQRLLAFARRQPLQAVSVDMARLVSGMAELISGTTGPQIRVVVELADDLPPAKADPNQLEMAVLNLAVNARDAMPEGGTLRISVDAVTADRRHNANLAAGRYVRLSVADTGLGMDEATRARAIEPFFSTKGVGKGTGLGLSMVHGLASQLGGAVTIHSAPGLGTNVELWLPEGESADAAAAGTAASEQKAVLGKGTVLLVDDEDLIRLSTADMLTELGYRVVEAHSAEEAQWLLSEGLTPDIMITDHLMPGMSGTDLARALQRDLPSTKVLIVSGYAEAAGIAPDLPRLTKPFRNDELAASLSGLN